MEDNYIKWAYHRLYTLKKVSNQEEFGEQIGYNKSYISELMNGRKPVTEKVKKKILEAFPVLKNTQDLPPDSHNNVKPNRLSKIKQKFEEIMELVREDGDFSELDKEEEEAERRVAEAKIAVLKAYLKKNSGDNTKNNS